MEEYLHLQPPELTEKEATGLAMVAFKLNEMRKWQALMVQLRESAITNGRVITPPGTPSAMPHTYSTAPSAPIAKFVACTVEADTLPS
jgi:hypothetical protein